MAQPCALTTKVSQISEKGALGSRLVTAMGRVIGTLELRRMVSGTFALCMLSLFHGVPLSSCPLLTCIARERAARPADRLKTLHLYRNPTRAIQGIPVVPPAAASRAVTLHLPR